MNMLNENGFDHIHVMRYMGAKKALLPTLVPLLDDLAGPGGLIVDLMAGTHAVGYALKRRHPIIANDVQAYSHVIGLALIENHGERISRATAESEVLGADEENKVEGNEQGNDGFRFFEETYADTYFSREQCREIDSIRAGIAFLDKTYRQALYLTALIAAMCYAQSTPGHFAEFLPPGHPRVQPLRQLSITESFLAKCDELGSVVSTGFTNRALQMDYRTLLAEAGLPAASSTASSLIAAAAATPFEASTPDLSQAKAVYVDPPYTAEQYSRFYHLLDTVVLYDHPSVTHRARYRADRFRSGFSSRAQVESEFDHLFAALSAACPQASVVVSYSSTGLLPIEKIAALARRHYSAVSIDAVPHQHSTQGKGANSVTEYIATIKS